MKKLFLLGYLVFGITLWSGLPQVAAEDWFGNDATGKLEDAIFNFRHNIYQIHLQPRAFVVKGDYLSVREDKIDHWPVFFVSVIYKNRQLYANSRTVSAFGRTRLIERWEQMFIDGGRVFTRGSPYEANQDPIEHFDEERDAVLRQFVRMDPVAMAVSGLQTAIQSGPSPDADQILTAGTLRQCRTDLQGNLVQESNLPAVEGLLLEVRYARRFEFMPDLFTVWWGTGDQKRLWTQTKTEWSKIDELWLPSKQLFSVSSPHRDRTESFELEVECKLDQGLLHESLIRLEQPDWREPTRDLFGEDWQRKGIVPPLLLGKSND